MSSSEQQSEPSVTETTAPIEKQNGATEHIEDSAVDPAEKLAAGKRSLACDEYPQAVEAFALTCQLLAEKHGEEGDELAEPYFYYGKSLLELARMENGVLGNALDGVAAEEENEADLSENDQFEKASGMPEEDREEVRNEVYTAMSADEKKEGEEAAKSEESTDTNTEKDDKSNEAASKDQITESEPAKAEEAGSTEDAAAESSDKATDTAEEEKDKPAEEEMEEGEGEEVGEEDVEAESSSQDDAEDADDVPNLQLAWEVLELSKKIFTRLTEAAGTEDKSLKIKLSEVFKALGEVSLETSACDQAVQDLQSCLQLQKECYKEDDRLLASTHYQLGSCHLLNRDYTQTLEELGKAKNILETRITNLQGKLSEQTDEQEKAKNEKELDELQQVLPEILAKIEDALDESRNAAKAEAEIKAVISSQKENGTTTIGFGDSSSSTAAAPIATKANDISNLVRKRKPEDNPPAEESKKAKTEPAGDGDKQNGIKNGDKQNGHAAEPAEVTTA